MDNTKPRPKGPLTKSTVAYDSPKTNSGGEMAFVTLKPGKKTKVQNNTSPTQFDSSTILSPFLDPKITERKVAAAKLAKR